MQILKDFGKSKLIKNKKGQKFDVPNALLDSFKEELEENLKKSSNKNDDLFSWQGGKEDEEEKKMDFKKKYDELSEEEKKKVDEWSSEKKKADEEEMKKKEDEEKKKEDEEKKEKEDELSNSALGSKKTKAMFGVDSAQVQKNIEKNLIKEMNKRNDAISTARNVLDSAEFEKCQKLTASEIQKQITKKLAPNINTDSMSDDEISGLYRGLVASQRSESRIDSLLVSHANREANQKNDSKSNKPKYLGDTYFLAHTPQHVVMNLKKDSSFGSVIEFKKACRDQKREFEKHLDELDYQQGGF